MSLLQAHWFKEVVINHGCVLGVTRNKTNQYHLAFPEQPSLFAPW